MFLLLSLGCYLSWWIIVAVVCAPELTWFVIYTCIVYRTLQLLTHVIIIEANGVPLTSYDHGLTVDTVINLSTILIIMV
jgi:hypothetical protein